MIDPNVQKQILLVRETGRTNMFDVQMVSQIAREMELDELVEFLKLRSNRVAYAHFILTGEA